MSDTQATFERFTEAPAGEPTLIEGLPGIGMVAAIAVDQVKQQLGLEHHGSIRSGALPPVVTFEDGRVQDILHVHAASDPSVMTLTSALPIPAQAFDPLADCVLGEMTDAFERAYFVTGAPANGQEEIGELSAIATTDEVRADLEEAGIQLANGSGAIGGVTGALVQACHHENVPAGCSSSRRTRGCRTRGPRAA